MQTLAMRLWKLWHVFTACVLLTRISDAISLNNGPRALPDCLAWGSE